MTMSNYWNTALLSAALVGAAAIAPSVLRAADRPIVAYYDSDHGDVHQWDRNEDKAYRIYLKESHLKYKDFSKLGADERRAYWNWRHAHSDAELKLDTN